MQTVINRIPKTAVYMLGLLPAAWLLFCALSGSDILSTPSFLEDAVSRQLGADPIKSLEHSLGLWGLRFMVAGLAVSPLRRLGGPSLIRLRRAIGLLAFFYVCFHFAVYLALDQGFYFKAIAADIVKRPYITIGLFGFLILIPLAITSNALMIKRLGAAWPKLHRWVYVAACAGVVHYLMAVKSWPLQPLVYAALVGLLLAIRLILSLRKAGLRRRVTA